jgi:hypothetical protein
VIQIQNNTGEFMEWTEIINHPSLRDLPFKIETNEWNKVVLSPITNKRGALKVPNRSIIWFNK